MNILSITPTTVTSKTGRMSDGSDWQEITRTIYVVELLENGRRYRCVFDHEPTEQEIAKSYAAGLFDFVGEDLQARVDYLESLVADLASIVLGV